MWKKAFTTKLSTAMGSGPRIRSPSARVYIRGTKGKVVWRRFIRSIQRIAARVGSRELKTPICRAARSSANTGCAMRSRARRRTCGIWRRPQGCVTPGISRKAQAQRPAQNICMCLTGRSKRRSRCRAAWIMRPIRCGEDRRSWNSGDYLTIRHCWAIKGRINGSARLRLRVSWIGTGRCSRAITCSTRRIRTTRRRSRWETRCRTGRRSASHGGRWTTLRLAGKRQTGRLRTGQQDSYYAWLTCGCIVYDITENWDVGMLGMYQRDKNRQGQWAQGVEVGRLLGQNLWVSAGYNWAGFHSDLNEADYTARGPYLRLRFKFDEHLFSGRNPQINRTLPR